jgi:hypothetical protein
VGRPAKKKAAEESSTDSARQAANDSGQYGMLGAVPPTGGAKNGGEDGVAPAPLREKPPLFASEEEKQQFLRERNREHAKNTRMRKKVFVESLKESVVNLQSNVQDITKQRQVGIDVDRQQLDCMMQLLGLRAMGEMRREVWSAYLADDFVCLMPITPYRSFSQLEVLNNQRCVRGVDGMIQDAQSYHVLANSIVDRRRFPDAKVSCRYHINTNDVVIGGGSVMCKWVLRTENAIHFGAHHEFIKQGMLKCCFDDDNKATSMHFMWDVMSTMLDVNICQGKAEVVSSASITANTLQLARAPASEPRIIFSVDGQCPITEVNGAWCELMGVAPKDVIGVETVLASWKAPENVAALKIISDCVALKCVGATCVVLRSKNGDKIAVYITLYPLCTEDKTISRFLGQAIVCSGGAPPADGKHKWRMEDEGEKIGVECGGN